MTFATLFSLEESMLFAESHILQILGNQAQAQYFGLQTEDIKHIRYFDLILEQNTFFTGHVSPINIYIAFNHLADALEMLF